MKRNIIIEGNFDKNKIRENLEHLKIVNENNSILTFYKGEQLSSKAVSDKYQVFDFVEYCNNILNVIEDYFIPERYKFFISNGIHELRLIGDEVLINNDSYFKMFNILSSSDKSRSLQINVGLIRAICTNGVVIGHEKEYSYLKTRHLKQSLDNKLKDFENYLRNFNISIDIQCETIGKLSNRMVSLRELANKLIYDENNNIKLNNFLKYKSFCNKLLVSKTDRLKNISDEQKNLISKADNIMLDKYKNVDIEIPSYTVFNIWTEIYRRRDSSVIKKETNRILSLI